MDVQPYTQKILWYLDFMVNRAAVKIYFMKILQLFESGKHVNVQHKSIKV